MRDADTVNTLYLKDPDTGSKECRKVVADGIQILAPGCALAPATALENLLAMLDVAKAHQPLLDS
jgi:[methyl-Co(III) methanol-specific corrinoid protein]:coenzyme M methyltransferase